MSRLLHDGAAGPPAAAARQSNVPASVIDMVDGVLHIDGEAGDRRSTMSGNPDALALLLHTSGTTSKPKTVPILRA